MAEEFTNIIAEQFDKTPETYPGGTWYAISLKDLQEAGWTHIVVHYRTGRLLPDDIRLHNEST